jgi:hypothetical protein
MKIINSIKSGFCRSIKSWKVVLIIWFLSLILISVLAIPLKGALNSAYGNSMITEKLTNGFDLEVFADLGSNLKSMISFLSAGLLFVILVGFLMNAFLTGGLFNCLRKDSGNISSSEFFRAAAKNFWSFLIISLIISVIINVLSAVLIGVPMVFLSMAETISEKTAFTISFITVLIFLILLPILLLVADYARAWQVSYEKSSCFRAIGFGFGQTFRKFWSSYTSMLILLLVQILFVCLVLSILPGWKPVTGGGVFLLFLLSQLFFYFKILLKTWRYANVTALMEQDSFLTSYFESN